MASASEWEATKVALGPLKEHYRFTQFVNDTGDASTSTLNFRAAYEDDAWGMWSSGEQNMILLAWALYGASDMVNLTELMAHTDNETWTRAIDAILIRRGVEVDIPAGQWLDKFPAND